MTSSYGNSAKTGTETPACPRLACPQSAKCKRKQYDGVRAALQFLCPLLTTYVAHSRSFDKLSEEHRRLVEQLTTMGTPASLSHSGPLPFPLLRLLMVPAWSDLIPALFSQLPRDVLTKPQVFTLTPTAEPSTLVNIYPLPALGSDAPGALPWTPELVERYAAALSRVHTSRPSRDLAEVGYLREAGVFARCVLAHPAGDICECEERGGNKSAGALTRNHTNPWLSLVDLYSLYLPDRSHIHELENLPQEIAIGELLAACTAQLQLQIDSSSNCIDCIVDVGGGNGILAAQSGERLGCPSLVIDPFFPSHAIDCCPRVWADTVQRERHAVRRQQPLRRVVSFFHEVEWTRDVTTDPQRTALVAKHLCGTAVDKCLAHLEQQGCLPRILALVPCCFNKGRYDEYIHREFLEKVLHVHDQDAYTSMARLTDWNCSVHQREAGQKLQSQQRNHERLPDGSQQPTQTTNATRSCRGRKSLAFLVPCADPLARTVEAVLNWGRVQWLEERGYVVAVREVVPDCVTPKNKCIVAYLP